MTVLHWIPHHPAENSQYFIWQIPRCLLPNIHRSDAYFSTDPFIPGMGESILWTCKGLSPLGTLRGVTDPTQMPAYFEWANQIRNHAPEAEYLQSPLAYLLVNEAKAYRFSGLWPISGNREGRFSLGYQTAEECWMLQEYQAAQAVCLPS